MQHGLFTKAGDSGKRCFCEKAACEAWTCINQKSTSRADAKIIELQNAAAAAARSHLVNMRDAGIEFECILSSLLQSDNKKSGTDAKSCLENLALSPMRASRNCGKHTTGVN
jgi:hypothetical protein